MNNTVDITNINISMKEEKENFDADYTIESLDKLDLLLDNII